MSRQQSLFTFYRKGAQCKLAPKEDDSNGDSTHMSHLQLNESRGRTQKKTEETSSDQVSLLAKTKERPSSSTPKAEMEGKRKLIENIAQKMRKPASFESHVPGNEGRPEVPLVPGTKRVRDDFPISEISPNLNKRTKLLELLGADEDLKQGAWAEARAKFEWMHSSTIRDGNGRKFSDPLYDRRTIQIPADILTKMSASQKQYWTTKSQYMDVVLFFKVGKFYELYELDAEIGHKELDWKMTVSGVGKCRQVGVPESGIEDAVQKLVARGYKVGRMEQIETSEQAKAKRGPKATVERKLVQVLTPSTLTDGIIRPDAIHLLALKEVKSTSERTGLKATFSCGFSFVDAAAGRCYIGSFCDDDSHSALEALLTKVAPQELLYELGGLSGETLKVLRRYCRPGLLPMVLTPLQADSEFLEPDATLKMISSRGYFKDYFKVSELHGSDAQVYWPEIFSNIEDKCVAASALGALLSHLNRIKMDAEIPNSVLCLYEIYKGSMRLDGQTIANLELLENTADGSKAGTLIGYLDSCVTPFGKRLLRRWICHPLQDTKAINRRLDAVDELSYNAELSTSLRGHLRKLPDLERLVARIRGFSGTSYSEVLPFASKQAFQRRLKTLCLAVQGMRRAYQVLECLRDASPTSQLLQAACDAEISLECLSSIEAHINTETVSLTIKQDDDGGEHNKEVSALNWLLLEFNEHKTHWSAVTDALSYIDVLLAFASATNTSNGPTCRPKFVTVDPFSTKGGSVLEIQGLWHPFAPGSMGGAFVPNNVHLGADTPRAVLLTGPNMGGKSTLLRATCLATLMAQLGCYVPSESCTLSPVDTIFTRIGARDRIMSGESTFLVECTEAASILQHATCHSLVVLDELGRGTSTFDGYAIAYAVFRHLVEMLDCRLLFATHYHPLTDEFTGNPLVSLQHMACTFGTGEAAASNSVPGSEDPCSNSRQLVFLYKLKAGPCPRSYGLQVALLAGLPGAVVEAAKKAGEIITSRIQTPNSSCQARWLQQICTSASDKATDAEASYNSLLRLWHEMRKSKF